MAGTSLEARTRQYADPLRNFKFQVEIFGPNSNLSKGIGDMGFTAVDGLNMSTEMIAYREGGWNTNPHKMVGMTDFSPVTLSSGVFYKKPGMWDLAKQIFSVQWGNGELGLEDDYRFDMLIRVFDHPVTKGEGAAVKGDVKGAVLAFRLYNAWIANVAFSGLNAMDNAILVSQMTIHHEGLDVFWGPSATANPTLQP
jgi:phage tail-like protein